VINLKEEVYCLRDTAWLRFTYNSAAAALALAAAAAAAGAAVAAAGPGRQPGPEGYSLSAIVSLQDNRI